MTNITRFDPSALNRAILGFDRIFDNFEARFANQLNTNYPPYNVIKIDPDNYAVEVAVAGFTKDEIQVEVENNNLTIKGSTVRDSEGEFIHRGLSMRDFTRTFQLAEHMLVRGAEIQNGILRIKLEREVPEEKKPKLIDIVEVK